MAWWRSIWRHPNGRLLSATFVKLSTELTGRALSLVATVWMARQLGEALFGWYNYALGVGLVLAQIADWGIQIIVSREVAVAGLAQRGFVQQGVRLKGVLSVVVGVLLLAATPTVAAPVRIPFLLFGAGLVAQGYQEFVAAVFRGQQKLGRDALFLFTGRLGWLLGVMWGMQAVSLSRLGWGIFVSTTLGAIWGFYLLWQDGWFLATPTATPMRQLWRYSWPLGIASFLSIAYTRVPVFLLQNSLGATSVAYFSVAQRLMEGMQILPAVVLAAVFPLFVATLAPDPRRAKRIGWLTALFLLWLGGSLALFFSYWSETVIGLMYNGAYQESALVWRQMLVALPFIYVNYGLTHFLIARQQQIFLTLFMGGMLLWHTGLSWWLIPLYGVRGPAISIVVAELFLLLGCLLVLGQKRPTVAAPLT